MLGKVIFVPLLAAIATARLVALGSRSYSKPVDMIDQMEFIGVNGRRNGLNFEARADGSFQLIGTSISTDAEGANWPPGSAFKFGNSNVSHTPLVAYPPIPHSVCYVIKGRSADAQCHLELDPAIFVDEGLGIRFDFSPVSAPPVTFTPSYHQWGPLTCWHRTYIDGVTLYCDGGLVCQDPKKPPA